MTAPVGGIGRRMAADTGQAALGRIVTLGVWTLMLPVLLRGLGPEGFALWSLFFALTGHLSALDLGLAPGTLRHVSAARARDDGREAGEYATLGIVGYVVLGAGWLALTPLLREPALDLLRIGVEQRGTAAWLVTLGPVAFASLGASMILVTTLQGWGRFDLANGVTVSSIVVQAGGALWALRHGHGLPGVVAASIVGTLAATAVGFVLLRVGAPGFVWGSLRAASKRVRAVVAFGGPLQVGNVLAVAHQQVDKLLLARYVTLAAVAPYELGLRASTVMGSLPQQLLMVLVSAGARLHATGDAAGMRAVHDRTARWVMALTASIAAALVAGAPRLLAVWVGEVPAGSDLAVVGLSLAMVAAIAAGPGGALARALGRTRYEAEQSAVALVLHVALGLWAVPRYGLVGAVAATACANLVSSAWFMVRFARATGWGVRALVVPAIAPVVVLGVVGAAGRALSNLLPHAAGIAGWGFALLVLALPAIVVVLTLTGTGFLPLAEWRALRAASPQAPTTSR